MFEVYLDLVSQFEFLNFRFLVDYPRVFFPEPIEGSFIGSEFEMFFSEQERIVSLKLI